MKWSPNISPSEIEDFKYLFSNLDNPWLRRQVVRILNAISRFIGFRVNISLPADIAEFKGQPEALRALRVLNRLRKNKVINSFSFETTTYPDEPTSQIAFVRLADIDRFGFSGKGASLHSKAEALWPALGEAVERHAVQFHYPVIGDYLDTSWNNLPNRKADIFDIAGFDEKLRRQGHPNFELEYDKNTNFRFVKALDLKTKEELWAPLQWFSFSHVQRYCNRSSAGKGERSEPLLSIPITTGAAAGQNETDAVMRGVLEIIERDAFIIYWLNQIPAEKIDLASFKEERFNELSDLAARYYLEIHCLYLKTDMPVHTICTIVIDRSGVGPAVIVGAKTGLDLRETAYDAFSETLAQRGIYRRMMDQNKDRRVSLEDIKGINHVERMLIWFEQDRLADIKRFISGPLVDQASLPVFDYSDNTTANLARLTQTLNTKGCEVFYREILSDKIRRLTEGLSVVMVKIPKMQPVYLEESLRSVGGDRLRSVPAYLGHKVDDTQADPFCRIPHPFP